MPSPPSGLIPPVPPVPAQELPLLGFLRAIRTNALTMWTERGVRAGRGGAAVPGADERAGECAGCDPSRAGGQSGELPPLARLDPHPAADHRQRPAAERGRRVAPSAPHHRAGAGAAGDADAGAPYRRRPRRKQLVSLAAQAAQGPINLLAAMQGLTLEIAGRSMFSLEMRAFGAPLRRLLTEFGERFARPHLFDMLLPPSVPTLRDLRRRRFQARWMRLIEAIMQDRLRAPQPDDAARPVRSAARRARSGNRRGFLAPTNCAISSPRCCSPGTRRRR